MKDIDIEFSNKFDQLNELLIKHQIKFGNYQTFPRLFYDKFKNKISTKYSVNQISLDYARYDFLLKNIKLENLSVVEYGSNLGFFCLSIVQDFNSITTGYEALGDYCKCAKIISELMDCENRTNFFNRSIKTGDIMNLENADLLVELNVLHHAGSFFDEEYVKKKSDWRNYALKRLSIIRKKYKNFFFQTGNMLNNQALFPSENSVNYIRSILEEAEWKIKKIGMVSDLSSPDLKYLPYDLEDINDIPQYKCRRDNKSNKVLYQNVKTKEYYYLKTGLANRPLWICE